MQTKKIKDTEVLLIHKEMGSFLRLDKIPYKSALTYVKSFTNTTLPSNSCIFEFELQLNYEKDYSTHMNRWTAITTKKELVNSQLSIWYRLNRSLKDGFCQNCLNNIASGKCTDNFVIEHIGKKFFADKYKEHTK